VELALELHAAGSVYQRGHHVSILVFVELALEQHVLPILRFQY